MSTLLVRSLMSKKPRTVYADETADLAELLMSLGSIRHLPVVDREGKLVGVLSNRDVLRVSHGPARPELANVLSPRSAVRVQDIMSPDLVTIGPETSAREAALMMRKNQFGCLPVVEDGALVGIITEADFVELAASLLEGR